MALVETIILPHLPDTPVLACLFKDVQNAPFLRQQLLEGNSDFEYAFLDAAAVLSRVHALAACFRAINDLLNHRLKSRNVHSEIVFSLSPNNNIAESFRRFGITDSTKHVLAIKVATSPDLTADSVARHLGQHVDGHSMEFADSTLKDLTDVQRLRKVYKFTPARPAKTHGTTIDLDDTLALESFVLGTMALKGS